MKEFSNPYDPTRPIEDRDRLYGRDDDLLWISQQLILRRRFIIVYGPELIGKTSLINCLPADLPEAVQPIRFDCRAHAGAPLPEVWAALAAEIDTRTGHPPAADAPDDPIRLIGDRLRQIALPPDGQVLLLVDDLQTLWVEGDGAASAAVLDVFAGLLGMVPALRLLVTMSEAAYDALNHPLRHGAEVLHVGPLSNEDAQQLVTRPAQGVIRFDPGAVRRLADIASNHPYYLQVLCQALFSRCARDGNLNQSDVDVVLGDLLQQPNPRFQALWDQSDAPQRAALIAMSQVKGTHGLTTRQEVLAYLTRYNGGVTPGPIMTALDHLAARGVLVRMGASSYRFAVKLFSYWLERHMDPEVVLERIDWERLSAPVAAAPSEPGDTADESEPPRRWGVGNWIVAGLGATAVVGLALWGLVFAGVWSVGLFDPTPTPTVARALVDFISPLPTPTATPVPPTPTPTSPIIVTRTLPAIVFRARNTGGGGDLSAWQLFVMNVDGSNRQRITFSNNEDITPIWSPDGSRIAYVSKIGENREILVIPAPGAPRAGGIEASFEPPDRYEAQAINISRHPANDWTIGWSPDSQYIAFSSNRAGPWQVFIARADGSGTQQITNDGVGRLGPVWSPDYQLMAYAGKDGDNWDIYVMPAPGPDGSGARPDQARRLTFAEGNDLAPIFSPDGKRIVFESNRDGNSEIYVMNVDGSNQRNLSNSPSTNDQGPVWSPDGKQILFYSGRAGNWDLFLVSSDGRNLVNLTNTPDIDEQEPSWRP